MSKDAAFLLLLLFMNVINIFDMNKKDIVRINENKLKQIVKESVKMVMKEGLQMGQAESFKSTLINLFEKVDAEGLGGAIPTLIAEALSEAKFSNKSNDKVLYWTAMHCERFVNRNKIVGRVNDQ